MAMNESDAQKIIYKRFSKEKNHPIVVPNCKALGIRGESDLISVTQAFLVHEFEIKLSKQDYSREFREKEHKHTVLEQGGHKNWNNTDQLRKQDVPNYFWFAISENVDIEDVPDYAGLLKVCMSGAKVEKDAPRIHSQNISERARKYLERGLTLRYWKS